MTLVGIDLGVHKIACSVFIEVDAGYALYLAADFSSQAAERDIQLMELAAFAHDTCQSQGADAVWIEKPILGNNRKYSLQLAETFGAVCAGLARERLQSGMDIRSVDNKAWKKQVIGSGNASKDDIRNYIHDVHPAYALLCGEDQDRFDACGIGLYGLQITARARDLHLAEAPE